MILQQAKFAVINELLQRFTSAFQGSLPWKSDAM